MQSSVRPEIEPMIFAKTDEDEKALIEIKETEVLHERCGTGTVKHGTTSMYCKRYCNECSTRACLLWAASLMSRSLCIFVMFILSFTVNATARISIDYSTYIQYSTLLCIILMPELSSTERQEGCCTSGQTWYCTCSSVRLCSISSQL